MTPLKTNNYQDLPIAIKSIKAKGKKYIVVTSLDELILSQDLMVEYRVSLDKRFDKKEYEKLLKASLLDDYFNKALNHLSYKMRTEKEIEEYLKSLKISEDDITKIINKLKKYKYLDDSKYVDSFIEDTYLKLKGLNYFKYELINRGIKEELINKALLKFQENEMFEELIDKYQKEANNLISLPINKQKEKLFSSLIRRGFTYQSVNSIMAKLTFSESIDDTFDQELAKIESKTNDKNKIITYLISKGFNYSYIKERIKK